MRALLVATVVAAISPVLSTGCTDDPGLESALWDEPMSEASMAPVRAPIQVALSGRLPGGTLVTVTAIEGGRRDRARLEIGGQVFEVAGDREVTIDLDLDAEGTSYGKVEIAGSVRAIFGLAAEADPTPAGPSLRLEGTGTVGEQDLDVAGAAIPLPDGPENAL